MKRKRIHAVLFGPQGSGKGTQGQILCEYFDIPLIGAGDLLRAEIEDETSMGRLVKAYVEQGMLAPDELVNAIAARRLKEQSLERGFLLDGYPRNVEQAEVLDGLVKINLAIQLKISDAEALRRLRGRWQCPACHTLYHEVHAPPAVPGKCSVCGAALVQREDDKDALIRQRLAAYHFITEPLAGYYRQRGVLLSVQAEQPIPLLCKELLRKMGRLGFTV